MTGFIESGFDPRDFEFIKEEHIKTENIPERFDYSRYTSLNIKNQGNRPTCVPHAISTMLEASDYKNEFNYDIDWVYERRPEPQGDGMTIRDALKILKSDLADPYMKYFRLRSILQIKWSIVANGPCIFALPVKSMDEYFWLGSEDFGGHAVCCVGYDDDGFIIQNSWGTCWGRSGMTKLPYDQLNYIIEAWGIL